MTDVRTSRPAPTRGQRGAAWAVHAYTATGSVFALLFLLAGVDGHLRSAFGWAVAAMVVDGSDGTLARRADVKRVVPEFEGALLDNVVDFLTYVFAPVVVLQQNGFLPRGDAGLVVAALPLLASCYQFCRTDAKTDDHLFLGFPSYWNVVAFYAVVLDLSRTATAITVVVCAVLVFVPIGYLYPSRATAFQRSSLALGVLWAVVATVLLVQLPDVNRTLALLSLLYVVHYVVVSLELTRRRRAARTA
ncbi:MAG: CDP-diacylglycerol-cholineO-phosphatidyl transferase [Frankiales bacterium]|nr:CDP-diacylglycerol-cholineO-phosphatidyl transferase [Frankiales bacterium]